MAWKKLKTIVYSAYHGATIHNNTDVQVEVQYDNSQNCITKTKIRFQPITNSSTSYKSNGYYILWAPNTNKEKILTLKTPGGTWPSAGPTIELTKSYTANAFAIEDFWICCTGSVSPNISARKITYADSGEQTFYWYFTHNRTNFKEVVNGWNSKGSAKAAGAVTVSKPTITDNGNNTFSITATAAVAGDNNAVKSTTLYWKKDTDQKYTSTTTLVQSNKAIAPASDTSASQVVYAYVVADGTYNDVTTSTVSATIKNYKAPSAPGKPILAASSYKNNRLTTKQKWTYNWTRATNGTTSSPVQGYRIRIYKNGSLVKGLKVDGTGSDIAKGTGTNDFLDRAGATNCSIIFDPSAFGFKTGDEIQVGIYAWAKNGAGSILWNGGGVSNAQVLSDKVTVQSAGVVQVRVNNRWVEGQVNCRVNGQWKEAESVYGLVNGKWKETV